MNRRSFFKTTFGLTALAAGVKAFALTPEKPLTSLDKVGVRRLMVNIKKFMAQAGNNYIFKPNTQETRNGFNEIINNYLESIKNRNGVYSYYLQCDETNNTPETEKRGLVIGTMWVQPQKTVDWIIFDFVISPMV